MGGMQVRPRPCSTSAFLRQSLSPQKPPRSFPSTRLQTLPGTHSVANVQVAAGLAALAVHSQRMTDGGLDDKSVQGWRNENRYEG